MTFVSCNPYNATKLAFIHTNGCRPLSHIAFPRCLTRTSPSPRPGHRPWPRALQQPLEIRQDQSRLAPPLDLSSQLASLSPTSQCNSPTSVYREVHKYATIHAKHTQATTMILLGRSLPSKTANTAHYLGQEHSHTVRIHRRDEYSGKSIRDFYVPLRITETSQHSWRAWSTPTNNAWSARRSR